MISNIQIYIIIKFGTAKIINSYLKTKRSPHTKRNMYVLFLLIILMLWNDIKYFNSI